MMHKGPNAALKAVLVSSGDKFINIFISDWNVSLIMTSLTITWLVYFIFYVD